LIERKDAAMSSLESQNEIVRVCSVVNEMEAAVIVGMLAEEGIVAIADSAPGSTIFGGLPFESGHHIAVPRSQVEKAKALLAGHPHFQDIQDEPADS